MSNETLERIVLAAQSGQHDACRQIYDRFQYALMGYCLTCTQGDRDLAKDLLQEIFIRAFKYLPKLQHPERFTSWLWTIAYRVCSNNGSDVAQYNSTLETFALERDITLESDDKQGQEHRIACVQELLEEIEDPQLQRIVQLKYTDPEHTTRQIAKIVGLPHGTVTVKLMRFRKAIKIKLVRALTKSEATS